MDNRVFRDAMGKFATGITIVTIQDDKHVHGMTVNAFMSVSLEPKLIAISIDKKTRMYDKINENTVFGVSILTEDQKDLSKVFSRQQDQDDPIPYMYLEGAPILPQFIVALSCKEYQTVVAGDHKIVIAEVLDLQINEKNDNPIMYYSGNYHTLKGR